MALEIITDRGTLDLYDGAEFEFYVTRQIHDLKDLETRNADFSKTIKIPPTPGNLAILEAYVATSGEYVIPCQVVLAGITIAPKAKLLIYGRTVNNQ